MDVAHVAHGLGRRRRVGGQSGGVEVPTGQHVVDDAAAVGCLPHVDGTEPVDLVAVAPPVHEGAEAEPGEQLGELGGVAERVRGVGHLRRPPVRLGHQPPLEQVADVALAGGKEQVRLGVQGRWQAGRSGRRPPAGPASRVDGEVVLHHDGLPVEQEAPPRILVELVEDPVDRVDEPGAEGLEGPVPRGPSVCARRSGHRPHPVRPSLRGPRLGTAQVGAGGTRRAQPDGATRGGVAGGDGPAATGAGLPGPGCCPTGRRRSTGRALGTGGARTDASDDRRPGAPGSVGVPWWTGNPAPRPLRSGPGGRSARNSSARGRGTDTQ